MIIFFSEVLNHSYSNENAIPINKEITAIPMNQITKIYTSDNLIHINYFDGNYQSSLNEYPFPELKTATLHYSSHELAYNKMREFYYAASKNKEVFYFEVM